MSNISIFVVVPNRGTIRSEMMSALLEYASTDQYDLQVILSVSERLDETLNHAVRFFLRKTSADFFLRLDADSPPTKNPLDLVELDKPVIGCPTPSYRDMGPDHLPMVWNTLDLKAPGQYIQHQECRGLQEVDAIGSGVIVIRRDVLVKTSPAPFRTEYNDQGFVSMTEYLAFCARAREAGFSIFAHYDYPCRHYETVDLLHVLGAHGAIVEKGGQAKARILLPDAPLPKRLNDRIIGALDT